MFRMNTVGHLLRRFSAILPVCMSAAPLSAKPVIGTMLVCIAIFAALALVPEFKYHENLFAFLLVWLCGIPTNIFLMIHIIMTLGLYRPIIAAVLYAPIILLLLFSMEEILFGILVRACFQKQRRVKFML